MRRITIDLTEESGAFIRESVETGAYDNGGDDIRPLIEHEKARKAVDEELRVMIQEGIDSGTSDMTVEEN